MCGCMALAVEESAGVLMSLELFPSIARCGSGVGESGGHLTGQLTNSVQPVLAHFVSTKAPYAKLGA